MIYHFWFSRKQFFTITKLGAYLTPDHSHAEHPYKYATIDGERKQYTTCSRTEEHGCSWDDMVYLGQGDDSSIVTSPFPFREEKRNQCSTFGSGGKE